VDLLRDITDALAPHGLNLIGTATVAAYEALVPAQYHITSLMPQAKTVLVLGNGGGAFWERFRAYCDTRPGYWENGEHPLDEYTVELIERTLTPLLKEASVDYRYLYPFRFWTEPVSFMHLAQAAGIAGPSILGVMIHPIYGPWIALRASVLLNQELSMPSVAAGFDPCPTCTERPCITTCPAQAISREKGWDIPACVTHRLQVAADCVDYCRARYDCVYGREHRYPLDELRYHQQRSFAEMRKYFPTQKKEEPS
jgi:epoxyqueuosine reductase QueG